MDQLLIYQSQRLVTSLTTFISKEYALRLADNTVKSWNIPLYGMNEVTANLEETDVSQVAHLVSPQDVARPNGKIEVLIGTDCCKILLNKIN